jgi:long-chain acyl-CoA synthetase
MSEVSANSIAMEDAMKTGMMLAYHAQNIPDNLAVLSEYGERTFSELNARINQLARSFRQAGLKPDDAVALLLVNRCEFLEVYYAALRTGMRVTPINWHLTGDDAAYIVDNCEARAFIADARCEAAALEALAGTDNLSLALCVGGDVAGFSDYETELARYPSDNIDAPLLGTQMLYTSGTTGRPKGVYRPREAAGTPQTTVTRASEAAAFNPYTDLCLCTGPAYHAAPLAFNIVGPISQGVGTVLMDKWDAEKALQLIEKHKITHTHMVATMFHRLLSLPEETRNGYNISSLRYVVHGAAPCPVHVKQAMMDWLGPVIYEYYAATEGGGGFFIGPQEWLEKPGSVGKPPEGIGNKIVDDEGNVLPQGEVGTIYSQAPAVGRFQYFKDEEKTDNSYLGDYFTLGDMGYFDEDGYLFLTGRSAETIISGGVNIYPQETDNVMLKHPAVADVCTIGVPSEEWGEEVKSIVELKEGFASDQDMVEVLIQFAREKLPVFKAPRTIDFIDALPRLPSGKIQRRKVREPYWAGRDRQI